MMLLTSSRKPAFKTKILCKKLALFFDAAYMTRGKMSMSEVLERGSGAVLLVVGEYHGNPGSLSFYDSDSRPFLSIRFSETSFASVSNTELRYGKHIFCGTDSSALFDMLNRFLFDNTGEILPANAFPEPKGQKQSSRNSGKSGKKEISADSELNDEVNEPIDEVSLGKPVKASKKASKSVSESQYDGYIRRLFIRDDSLDFYSNDRLFLRLYVKGTKASDIENN